MAEDALAALTSLENDLQRPRLFRRVTVVLDQLEDDPEHESVRRRRFTNGLWAVLVSGEEDWVILWDKHAEIPDAVTVLYLGPDTFL